MSDSKEPKRDKPKGQLQRLYEKSTFYVFWEKYNDFKDEYYRIVYAVKIITVMFSLWVSGALVQWFGRSEEGFRFFACFGYGIKHIWLTLIILAFLAFLIFRTFNMVYKGTSHDADFNIDQSDSGTSGTAEKMGEEEAKKTFFMGNYKEILGTIVGADLDDMVRLYSVIRDYKTKLNGNYLVFGPPGSGKSRCLVIPMLMQIMRRGESAIITDSKGAIYKIVAEMARARGYLVKAINFNPALLAHSDGLNFLASIKPTDRIGAFSFAKTIIDNTSDGKNDGDDYFSKQEMNLLVACILLAVNNEGIMKPTLGDIYIFLSTHSVQSLEAVFLNLPDSHPAKGPFNIYHNSSDNQKGDFLGGLAIRLQVFNDPLVQKVTGTDNISFTEPGKKKCLYFIIMSDQDPSMSFLIALTFHCLYTELVKYADSQGGDKEILPVKVNFVLDEYYSCGIIPYFSKRLSNVRSRGIDTMIIVQSLAQLMEMHPDNTHSAIIDCCSQLIYLGGNDPQDTGTAKLFSDRSGVMTARAVSQRSLEDAGDPFHMHGEIQMTTQDTQRPVYTVDECIRLDPAKLLIAVNAHNVKELMRIDYSAHPMCKEIRPADPNTHIPDWLSDATAAELEVLGVPHDEKYVKEGIWDIELCTESDFNEPWTPQKERKLKEAIAKEKAAKSNGKDSKAEKYKKKTEKLLLEKIRTAGDAIISAREKSGIEYDTAAALTEMVDQMVLMVMHGVKKTADGTDIPIVAAVVPDPPQGGSKPHTPSAPQNEPSHFGDLKF